MIEELVGRFVREPAFTTETWVERRDIPPTRQPSGGLGWKFSHRTWSWWVRIR